MSDRLALPPGANPLLGLVLCGGESRRMGRDKGLLLTDERPWAVCMADKLLSFQLPVVFSINALQVQAYSAILPPDRLITDALDLPGPQNGLFTVHRRFPDHDLLMLACDMIDLDEKTIGILLAAWSRGTADDFFVFEEGEWLQPFCGIYTAAGLDRVGTSADGRLQTLLRMGRTLRLSGASPRAFNNYNRI